MRRLFCVFPECTSTQEPHNQRLRESTHHVTVFVFITLFHGKIVVKSDVLRGFILLKQNKILLIFFFFFFFVLHQKQYFLVKFARNKRISMHPHIGFFRYFPYLSVGGACVTHNILSRTESGISVIRETLYGCTFQCGEFFCV